MTDERDPKVSQRYRELPRDEPSRELDQAILTAAHRSLDKPHAPLVVPAGRHRWYFSLAAAAVLVLAIAVTVHVERQQPDAESTEAPPPAPAPAPQEVKPASPPAPPAAQPRRDSAAREEQRRGYTPEPPPTAKVEPQPGAGARADSADEQARQNVEALKKNRAAAEVAPPPAAAASRAAPAPMASQYAVTPQRELERIADLRRQGRDEEADKALAEFRKRHPDYVISGEMKAKVERK